MSLLDTAVAISIAALLLAMALPAIQGAREAGRRTICSSRLKALVGAVQAYAEANRFYPTPHLLTRGHAALNMMSIQSYLLPYLEQADIYDCINFSLSSQERVDAPLAANETVRNLRVAGFLCPLTSSTRQLNSYRFNLGLYREAVGPFRDVHPTKPQDISAGLSKVAFASERIGGSFDLRSPTSDLDVVFRNPGSIPLRYVEDQVRRACELAPIVAWDTGAGKAWFFVGMLNTNYNHNGVPNESSPSCELTPWPEGVGGMHGPRSWHSRGVNLAFGDSHVEFIGNEISSVLWREMASRRTVGGYP